MALRDDIHGGIGQNLSHSFHSPASQPAIPGEKRQQLGQNFLCRVDSASRKKIVKPADILSVVCVADLSKQSS
jgi:hypothetical protein